MATFTYLNVCLSAEMASSLGRNFLIVGVGRMLTQFIGLLLLPVYAAALDPGEFGLLDLVITLGALLIPVFSLHVEMAAFRFLIDVRGDSPGTGAILRTVLRATALQSGLAGTAMYGAVFLLHPGMAGPVAAYVAAVIWSGALLQVARGLGRNLLFAVGGIVCALLVLAGTALALGPLGMGAEGAVWALAFGNAGAAVVLVFAIPEMGSVRVGRGSPSSLGAMLRYSLPLLPNSLSWWIVSGVDRLVIASAISTSELGVYAFGARLAGLLSAVGTVYSLVWSEAASEKRAGDRSAYFREQYASIAMLVGAGAASVICLLGAGIPLFAPAEYQGSMAIIPLLVLGSLFYTLAAFLGGIYVSEFRSGLAGLTSAFAAAAKLILALTLIPALGIIGAAVSTLVSYALLFVVRLLDTRRRHANMSLPPSVCWASVGAIGVATAIYHLGGVWANLMVAMLASAVCLWRFAALRKAGAAPTDGATGAAHE